MISDLVTIRKRRAVVRVVVAVVLVVVIWSLSRGRSRTLPVFGGKTVEQWFFGPTGHPGLEKTEETARVAFKEMGTNCVPFLLEKAKTRETALNRFYCWIHPKLPGRVRAKLQPALTASYIQNIAYRHLQDLGSACYPMTDEILASVKMIDDPSTRLNAFHFTEFLALRMSDVEKEKAYFLSCLNDADFQIQLHSAITLSHVDYKLTNGVPILLMAVTNNAFLAQSITSQWPAAMRPLVMPHLTNSMRSLRKSAADALWIVVPEVAKQVRAPK